MSFMAFTMSVGIWKTFALRWDFQEHGICFCFTPLKENYGCWVAINRRQSLLFVGGKHVEVSA